MQSSKAIPPGARVIGKPLASIRLLHSAAHKAGLAHAQVVSAQAVVQAAGDRGLYSRKVVNDERIIGVRPAITIHETYRTYDCRKFKRKFTTYLQLSYGES